MEITLSAITIANAIILSFFTAGLFYYTKQLYQEAEKTRIQNITPQVSLVFFPIGADHLGLKVSNTGKSDAIDLNIQCLNDGIYNDERKSCKYNKMLSKQYNYLPVNQEYKYIIGRYSLLKQECLIFNISFSDMSRQHRFEHKIVIPIIQMENSLIATKYEENVARSLKNISKKLNDITTFGGNSAIRCHTYSQEYREDKSLLQKIDDIQDLIVDLSNEVSDLKKDKNLI